MASAGRNRRRATGERQSDPGGRRGPKKHPGLFWRTELAAAYQFPPGLKIRAATFDVIKRVVEDELPTRKEEWLFFFWGGHGILDSERSRRVFVGDARAGNKQNVNLISLR